MSTTVGDGDGMFLEPPGTEAPEQQHRVADESEESMRRLRDPFQAPPAEEEHAPRAGR